MAQFVISNWNSFFLSFLIYRHGSNLNTTFSSCGKLTTPPSSIPETVTSMSKTFMSCSNLESVPSVPSKVTNLYYAFYGCKKLTGDIEINANPTKYGKALSGTNITSISGSTTLKDELLATKNN